MAEKAPWSRAASTPARVRRPALRAEEASLSFFDAIVTCLSIEERRISASRLVTQVRLGDPWWKRTSSSVLVGSGSSSLLEMVWKKLLRTARWFFLEESAMARSSLRWTTYDSTWSAP